VDEIDHGAVPFTGSKKRLIDVALEKDSYHINQYDINQIKLQTDSEMAYSSLGFIIIIDSSSSKEMRFFH
jgi:hypothetical protein